MHKQIECNNKQNLLSQKAARRILCHNANRIVDLNVHVQNEFQQVSATRWNHSARRTFQFVCRWARCGNLTYHNDSMAVLFVFVCIWTVIWNVHFNCCRWFTIFYQICCGFIAIKMSGKLVAVTKTITCTTTKQNMQLPLMLLLRFVALALLPKPMMSAVRMALLPLPFWPISKLVRRLKSTVRFAWHIKLRSFTVNILPLRVLSVNSGPFASSSFRYN